MNTSFTNPITPRVVDVFYMSPPAPGIFINAEYVQTYECAEGRCGDPTVITIPAGRFFAATQEEADARAVALSESLGAAAIAACGYPSEVFDQDYECPEGYVGDPVHIHFDAGAFCGPTQEAANALAQAAGDAQAAEELVCTPPPGAPELLMQVMNVGSFDYPQYAFEPTRLTDDNSSWVGYTLPTGTSPVWWYHVFRLNDSEHYPPSGGTFAAWSFYNGTSWNQVFSGYPVSEPTESQFPQSDQWSYKAGADPTAPPAGTGPLEIQNSPTPHMVGIGELIDLEDHDYPIVVRLTNTGTSPLIFGTPIITIPSGESAFNVWSLSTYSIPDIAPGAYYDLTVTGRMNSTIPFLDSDIVATIKFPSNRPDGDVYVDFSLALALDD